MPTVEIKSRTFIDKRHRLRIFWDCELKILGGGTRIYLRGYFSPEYLAQDKDDFWEILATYRGTTDVIVDGSTFQTLDMASVLRAVIEDIGLNPDRVVYKFMPAEEKGNNENQMDSSKSETKDAENDNPEVF